MTSPTEADPAAGAETAAVTVDGTRLVYESHGAGPGVLLICGTGQAAATWDLHQVPAITEAGYRVITFDNRGMPPSDCPASPYTVQQMAVDAAGLIEALELAPCHVAGLSLGAMVTQELALLRPELVRSAVMMGTFARQDEFRRAVMRSWVELDRSGVELPRLYEAVTSAFSLFSPNALCDDEFVRQHLEFSLAAPPWQNPGRLGQHEADLAYQDRLDALGAVRVPCLVVGFEADMLTPPSLSREVAAAIPGCRYLEIAGAGHAGPFTQPGDVNAVLLRFFAET